MLAMCFLETNLTTQAKNITARRVVVLGNYMSCYRRKGRASQFGLSKYTHHVYDGGLNMAVERNSVAAFLLTNNLKNIENDRVLNVYDEKACILLQLFYTII